MNVLHLTPRFDDRSGGDGLYAYHLAFACYAQGSSISILTIRDDEFVLLGLRTSPIDGSDEPRVEILRRLGSICHDPVRKNFFSMTAARAIRDALATVSPDVIHVHGIHQFFTLSAIAPLREFRGPVLITVHDYKILCGNAGFFSDSTGKPCVRCLHGRYLPAVFERCKKDSILPSLAASLQMGMWSWMRGLDVFDRILCGSEFVVSLLSDNEEICGRLTKIRFPVLHRHAEGPARQGNDFPSVDYIGRMVLHKGPTIFAEAVRDLHVRVRLYGDGPLREATELILAGRNNVRFAGWVLPEELDRDVGSGTIVVLPYLAMETYCYAVVESMARGCCVVASARGAIPELITDSIDGLLVKNPTPGEFREAICSLLEDPARVISLGAQASRSASKLPSMAVHASELLALYDSLVAQRREG